MPLYARRATKHVSIRDYVMPSRSAVVHVACYGTLHILLAPAVELPRLYARAAAAGQRTLLATHTKTYVKTRRKHAA